MSLTTELWVDKQTTLNRMQQRAEGNGVNIHAAKPITEERGMSYLPYGPYRIERIDRGVCQVVYEDIEGIEMYRSEDLDISDAADECRRLNSEWAAEGNSYYKMVQAQWKEVVDEWRNDETTDDSLEDTYIWVWSRRNPTYRVWDDNRSDNHIGRRP